MAIIRWIDKMNQGDCLYCPYLYMDCYGNMCDRLEGTACPREK